MKKKFIIFYVVYTIIIVTVISIITLMSLFEIKEIFVNDYNKQIMIIMADKIFEKTIITFLFVMFFIILLSIPIGLYLLNIISKNYFDLMKKFFSAAKERVQLGNENDIYRKEEETLNQYLYLLRKDQEKIIDLERLNGWKDGARFLIHEIKTPLTPLKLSTENLFVKSGMENDLGEELEIILASIDDVEKILFHFKKIIDIEFGKKEKLSMMNFIDEIKKQMDISGYKFKLVIDSDINEINIISERSLLKIVFNNLIKNGIEANENDFEVKICNKDETLLVEFVTKEREIKTEKIFKLGYSEKGKKRGFGLFLCKQISDYLNLNLGYKNSENNVIFFIEIEKEVK